MLTAAAKKTLIAEIAYTVVRHNRLVGGWPSHACENSVNIAVCVKHGLKTADIVAFIDWLEVDENYDECMKFDRAVRAAVKKLAKALA
jgi:hypothetical protein